jgi:hypothetical protein
MLNSSVLVLNRSYLPIHVTSVRRAFSLLYQGIARAVDEQYQTFDFDGWRQLAVARDMDAIGTAGGLIRVPRVIVLIAFDRLPSRHVRFSRINLMARDNFRCQYCGGRPSRSELNLDHVVPLPWVDTAPGRTSSPAASTATAARGGVRRGRPRWHCGANRFARGGLRW